MHSIGRGMQQNDGRVGIHITSYPTQVRAVKRGYRCARERIGSSVTG